MRIKALAPWFGGKRNLARTIAAELGPHRVYWSLCCGSMPELLVMPPCVMETAVDLHGDLTNLARIIQDRRLGPMLYRRLRRCLMCEGLFADSAAVIRSAECVDASPDLDRAFHYFTVAWLGRNGVAGTSSYNSGFCVRYTAKGGHAAKRWRSAVGSIPAWQRRLANVTILTRDIFEVLPRIQDDPGTSIYVDPPYLVKGAKYQHDFTDSQHQDLATALARFRRARVVVSYYEDPRLGDLYPRWTKRDVAVTKALVSQGMRDKRGAVKAPEVLLINGPSLAGEPGLFRKATK